MTAGISVLSSAAALPEEIFRGNGLRLLSTAILLEVRGSQADVIRLPLFNKDVSYQTGFVV